MIVSPAFSFPVVLLSILSDVIFPLAIIGGFCVYLLKNWIIVLLFSNKFLPMADLFLWQMIGDALKIGSWIIAYLMLSKAMTKLFVMTEIVFAISSITFPDFS